MATYQLTCLGCGGAFTAGSSRAKWCRPGCKKRLQRAPDLAAQAEVPVATAGPVDTVLVTSVRAELEAAGRAETFHGQLALQLARKVSDAEATGVAGLSRELRTVMAAALEGIGPDPDPDEPEAPVDDALADARRRRAEARQAAGL